MLPWAISPSIATAGPIIVSVWLPHAALIPIYWDLARPVRLPLPIIPYPSSLVSTPRPITSVDSGLADAYADERSGRARHCNTQDNQNDKVLNRHQRRVDA